MFTFSKFSSLFPYMVVDFPTNQMEKSDIAACDFVELCCRMYTISSRNQGDSYFFSNLPRF